jgi:hypothetical protein
MLSDGRCPCGCRIFFDRKAIITTELGAILTIPSGRAVECARCNRALVILGEDAERKTVQVLPAGAELEKFLLICAMKDWKNMDHPEKNPDFVTIDPGDKIDFKRLGLVEEEVRASIR